MVYYMYSTVRSLFGSLVDWADETSLGAVSGLYSHHGLAIKADATQSVVAVRCVEIWNLGRWLARACG